MRNKRYICLIICAAHFLVLSGFILQAKAEKIDANNIVSKYADIIVQINVTIDSLQNKHGYGFVVGEDKENYYIATARHVILGEHYGPDTTNISINVTFAKSQEKFKAELIKESEEFFDLALIMIKKHNQMIDWEDKFAYLTPQKTDNVWFIENNSLSSQVPGKINAFFTDTDRIEIESIIKTRKGHSGTPIFTAKGIIGMAVQLNSDQETIALDINKIRNVVIKQWEKPWNLKTAKSNLNWYLVGGGAAAIAGGALALAGGSSSGSGSEVENQTASFVGSWLYYTTNVSGSPGDDGTLVLKQGSNDGGVCAQYSGDGSEYPCAYTVSGNNITVTWETGEIWNGTLNGPTQMSGSWNDPTRGSGGSWSATKQ